MMNIRLFWLFSAMVNLSIIDLSNTSDLFDPCPKCKIKGEFEQFQRDYNRSYRSDLEFEYRFSLFETSLDKIDEMNKDRTSMHDAFFAVTKYADFDLEDFGMFSTGSTGNSGTWYFPGFDPVDLSQIPDKLDWSSSVVPEVRDQGTRCSASYAYAAADLVSSYWSIENRDILNETLKLSVQTLIDCIPAPNSYGCLGGDPFAALRMVGECATCQWPLESCYPYDGERNEDCRVKKLGCRRTDPIHVFLKDAFQTDASGDEEMQRVASLLMKGPIVAMVTSDDRWQHYSRGILRGSQCPKDTKPNHSVLITGYDYNGSVPYYIAKNSWGKNWGENGYVRIEAGVNACSVVSRLVGVHLKGNNGTSAENASIEPHAVSGQIGGSEPRVGNAQLVPHKTIEKVKSVQRLLAPAPQSPDDHNSQSIPRSGLPGVSFLLIPTAQPKVTEKDSSSSVLRGPPPPAQPPASVPLTAQDLYGSLGKESPERSPLHPPVPGWYL